MSTTCGSTACAESFPVGQATMSPAMQSAGRYARYLYDCVQPWLEAPILEVGTGFGTYTGLLLRHGRVITADIDPVCLDRARQRYRTEHLETARVDLNDTTNIHALAKFGARSIFCSNVLEHIADDVAALRGLREIIAPGGTLCLIVPAHPKLYGFMDSQAGHFRRYTRRSLSWALSDAGWCVETTYYINALGGAGWWLNQQMLSPRPLDARAINTQLVLYDRIAVPFARMTDRLFTRLFGLSVVAIARREESQQHTMTHLAAHRTDDCAA